MDYGSESALRVVSRDGERQVSSTHGDETRDLVGALGDNRPEQDQAREHMPGGAPGARADGPDGFQARPPGGDDQNDEPQPAEPYLPDVQVPSNQVMKQFTAGTTEGMPNS